VKSYFLSSKYDKIQLHSFQNSSLIPYEIVNESLIFFSFVVQVLILLFIWMDLLVLMAVNPQRTTV
jgi:type IV secretory pathway TrbL component